MNLSSPLEPASLGSTSYRQNWHRMMEKLEPVRQALLDWMVILYTVRALLEMDIPQSSWQLIEHEIRASHVLVTTLILVNDKISIIDEPSQQNSTVVDNSREAYARSALNAFVDLATRIFTPNTSSGLYVFSIIDPERNSSAILYDYFSQHLTDAFPLSDRLTECSFTEAQPIAGELAAAYLQAKTCWTIIWPVLERSRDLPEIQPRPPLINLDNRNADVFSSISDALSRPSSATHFHTSSYVPTLSPRSGSGSNTGQGLEELARNWAETGRRLAELAAWMGARLRSNFSLEDQRLEEELERFFSSMHPSSARTSMY